VKKAFWYVSIILATAGGFVALKEWIWSLNRDWPLAAALYAFAYGSLSISKTGSNATTCKASDAATAPQQRFKMGENLRRLIYEKPASEHNPWSVISGITMLMLGAQQVALNDDEILASGLSPWASAWLQRIMDSYE
jgi:hypothetical protein